MIGPGSNINLVLLLGICADVIEKFLLSIHLKIHELQIFYC